MVIRWDDRKEAQNLEKHGVSFLEAATVLSDPLALANINGHPDGDRFQYLGCSSSGSVLYVVTVEKTADEITIVSARTATPRERKGYEEG